MASATSFNVGWFTVLAVLNALICPFSVFMLVRSRWRSREPISPHFLVVFFCALMVSVARTLQWAAYSFRMMGHSDCILCKDVSFNVLLCSGDVADFTAKNIAGILMMQLIFMTCCLSEGVRTKFRRLRAVAWGWTALGILVLVVATIIFAKGSPDTVSIREAAAVVNLVSFSVCAGMLAFIRPQLAAAFGGFGERRKSLMIRLLSVVVVITVSFLGHGIFNLVSVANRNFAQWYTSDFAGLLHFLDFGVFEVRTLHSSSCLYAHELHVRVRVRVTC